MLGKKCLKQDSDKKLKESNALARKYEYPSSSKANTSKSNPIQPQIKKPNPEIIPKKSESTTGFKKEITKEKIKYRTNPNDIMSKSKKEKNFSYPKTNSEKNTKIKIINKLVKYQIKKKKKVNYSISIKNEEKEEEREEEEENRFVKKKKKKIN